MDVTWADAGEGRRRLSLYDPLSGTVFIKIRVTSAKSGVHDDDADDAHLTLFIKCTSGLCHAWHKEKCLKVFRFSIALINSPFLSADKSF